jgi:hypothetical protein
MPEEICFAVFFFLPFFPRGHTLHVFHLCFVPVLFSFVNLLFPCVCVCLLAENRQTTEKTQKLIHNCYMFQSYDHLQVEIYTSEIYTYGRTTETCGG